MPTSQLLDQINLLLTYLKCHSPYYQRKNLPDRIQNLADYTRIPTTPKQDLSDQAQLLRCVPEDQISEIVSTSGSTGVPLYIQLTAADLQRLEQIEAANFSRAGFSPRDVVLITTTMDKLFIAGMAYYRGLQRIGSTVIRSGTAPPPAQINLIRDLSVNALVGVPSFLLKLAAALPDWSTHIRRLMLVGESIYTQELNFNPLGQQLRQAYPQAELFSSYGNTELQGAFCDCPEHAGLHSHQDFYYIEVLDESGNPVAEGKVGELTVTTFGIHGMPLLRYRTGDLTYTINTPCRCGNPSPRIGPILGRHNQLLKIKGTTLYPLNIISALHKLPEIEDFLILAEKINHQDTLAIRYCTSSQLSIDDLSLHLKGELKLTPNIEKITQQEIDRIRALNPSRKKQFFLDKR